MVGRTEEELLATTFLAITHPEDIHLHEKKTQMMLSGRIDHYSLEKRYRFQTLQRRLWPCRGRPKTGFVVSHDRFL